MSYSNIAPKILEAIAEDRQQFLAACDQRFLFEARKRDVAEWLDVGTGDGGRAVKTARRLGVTVDLLEPSDLMPDSFPDCAEVRQLFRRRLEDFPFDRCYHAVTLFWSVLGYIRDWRHELRRIFLSLPPGGFVCFDVNNFWNVREYGLWEVLRNTLHNPLRIRKEFEAKNLGQGVNVGLFSPILLVYLKLRFGGRNVHFEFLDYQSGEPASLFSGQIFCFLSKSE